MQRQHRKPRDENKDHMNFLQHVAGLNTDLNMSNSDGGNFDSAVTTSRSGSWDIRKPSGRLPFDANLLTVGQVKFHPQKLALRVERKLKEATAPITHQYNAHNVATSIFREVYTIFENRRCARMASQHFHRPKIWRDHLKDVKAQDANLGYFGRSYTLRGNSNKKHELNFGWFRQYLYQNATLREIRSPIIEELCRKNKDLIARVRDSVNPATTILAALEIASRFHFREEHETTIPDENGTQSSDASNLPTESTVVKTAYGMDEDEAEAMTEAVVEKITDEIVEENKTEGQAERQVAGVEQLGDDASFEDIVGDELENRETIDRAGQLSTQNMCGAFIDNDQPMMPFSPTFTLDSLELEGSLDRSSYKLGSSGHRVSRNAWRLPALGDPNVFKKHPQTASQMVILVDMSASMGEAQYSFMPIKKALDTTSIVLARFPDTKAYGFTSPDKMTRAEARDNKTNAVLLPIHELQYPNVDKSATPLCGAMKGLEELVDLSDSKILIITDGEPNMCSTGSANECVASRASAWSNKGLSFATMYLTNGRRGIAKYPLPVELSVTVTDNEDLTSNHIMQVLSFFKG